MELPFTVILSIVLANESLSTVQILLIALSFIGIMLSITSSHIHEKLNKGMFEKGVILASIGSVGLALTNFLVGISSQRTSPLMAIWFSNVVIAVFCFAYILCKREERRLLLDMKKFPAMVFGLTFFDNTAWVAYAFATTIIPISIATTISESFVALAVLLGIFINKEKLKPHQKVGIILCIVSVLLISYFSE
jgi:drug/metabolite transporter (DMT)-like permease